MAWTKLKAAAYQREWQRKLYAKPRLPSLNPANDLKRFKVRIAHRSGCWIWTGARHSKGYANFSVRGRMILGHRYAYETFTGPIPEGLTLDHLCRNRACVNPAHLEAVTMRENLLRGETLTARNAVKTRCPQGHRYTDENTRVHQGTRHCRACNRKWCRESRARRNRV